jgi:4'-phosphopantetheinyl transferase
MSIDNRPWSSLPASVCANRNQVHVWRVSLDRAPDVIERLARILSPEEFERSRRLRRSRDRERYVVRRSVLRHILSRYVGEPPEQLRFHNGRHGKPIVAGQLGPDAIRFNASGSEALAVYSVARGRETGIDIERSRGGLTGRSIADRFFSQAERAMLNAVPADQYDATFLRCWTRMEAYLKGTGHGLAGAGECTPAPGWVVQDLIPAPGYVGAVAVEGTAWTLSLCEWRADT